MTAPIFGLVSSYNEGQLAQACVRDLLKCCDRVLVLDGPIGDVPALGNPSVFWPTRKPPGNLFVRHGGPWATDAAKRTELVKWAQRLEPGPCWAVVLDGDEIMPWSEYLPDYIYHSDSREEAGGVTLKVSFEDGQLYESTARCFRLETVEAYLVSGVQIMLKSGVVWSAPISPAKRQPFHGEPHIFHRGYLRPPDRGDPAWRMSKRELEEIFDLARTSGII